MGAMASALRGGTVRDVMQIHMLTAVPEMTVRELAQTLLEGNVRSVPVLDSEGKILGVASQADVMRAAMSENACVPASGDGGPLRCMDGMRVRSVMGPVGATVTPDQSVRSLVRLFVRERVQRALVVDNGMLLGIVTPIDVLGAIDATG